MLNKFNKAPLSVLDRFLHSTGQLLGGQDGGFFITTKDYDTDFDIPGEGMSYTLQRAQALGDIEALKQREGDPRAS